jgi:hypothetical protein
MGGIGQATRDWAAKWPSRYCPLTGSRMPTAVHRDLRPDVIVGTDGTVKNCWLESGRTSRCGTFPQERQAWSMLRRFPDQMAAGTVLPISPHSALECWASLPEGDPCAC